MRDSLANNIRIFFEERGIDPFYAGTVLCLLILLSYWKDIQNWDNIPSWNKGLILSGAFLTVLGILASLFRLFGLF